MTRVVVGAANQTVSTELRELIGQLEGAEVIGFSESTVELSVTVGRDKPDVVMLHDVMGPQSTKEAIREIASRAPATAVIVVNSTGDVENAMTAMEAGAKAVLSYPVMFDDLLRKFEDAREWAGRMAGLLSGATPDTVGELGRNGRVTVVAGAKGGVGTTTIATHLAYDLVHKVQGVRVCLVDLDLLAGDVSGLLEARQRVTIADVAKVSQDLDASTISDALVLHESGVSLLLAPAQIQETEFVTPSAVRAILGLLRRQFHVIIVDGGSRPTPAQAAAVEIADEVVAVVTPDVLAMRSYRRMVNAWESLGVRTEQEIAVLVNRASREDVLNHPAIAKLTSARLVSVPLPSALRRLERGVNARNPDEVRESAWWSAVERVGAEVGVHASATAAAPAPTDRRGPRTRKPKRSRGARAARAEAGQVALETVSLVPLVAFICLLVWQVALSGLAFVWNGHAANAAARAHAMGDDPHQAARDAMPGSMRDKVSVTVLSDGRVRVSTSVPVMCPGCASLPAEITQTASVTEEP
jgi:pilus assembly protein CpaE